MNPFFQSQANNPFVSQGYQPQQLGVPGGYAGMVPGQGFGTSPVGYMASSGFGTSPMGYGTSPGQAYPQQGMFVSNPPPQFAGGAAPIPQQWPPQPYQQGHWA